MKYQINKTNYCTFNIFKDNKLDGRSYFIPYPNRRLADKVSLCDKRYKSNKVQCLNGEWDFIFYPLPKDVPDVLDTDLIKFDKIDVPSCWQFRGYDKPFYVNIRYQFPCKPPIIPTEEEVGKCFSWIGFDQKISLRFKKPKDEYNFVGIYRRNLYIHDASKNYIISFLGVASCLDLYINGEYVGYSEGSHNTAEFDISKYLHDGDNEIVVVVHRWCNGSYLEDQDMFRNNGIFRDVLLRINEASDIYDIDIKTKKIDGKYNLTIKVNTFNDTKVKVSLVGHSLDLVKEIDTSNKEGEIIFNDLDVKEWNAEEPNLYDVYIETPTSCVKESVGFKHIEIKGDLFLLNGRLFKVHGVNHHDTHPDNGYTLTFDDYEKDVLLCKEYNIDTIRTSHYPPDPFLLELADYHGLYIIDENDLETHGVWAGKLPPSYNVISHDKKWEEHYIDRISRLYNRDKIHQNTSIIMFSLGNEAGGYYNTDKMYHYLKEHTDIPVHYEGAIHSKRVAYDVGSEMYPSVNKVALVGKHQRKEKELNNRPYILCEYVHAMGVGPGNVESYWEEFYKYPNLMGGCVWEMIDHAVRHADGSYTYGGDHGEWEHDGNFCVDGLFYPDRRPSTGAKVIKHAYRPIRIRHIKDDVFEIFNVNAFRNADEFDVNFVFNDGTDGKYVFEVGPLTKKEVKVNIGKEIDGNLSCLIKVIDRRNKREVSYESLVIKESIKDIKGNKEMPSWFNIDKNGKLRIKLNDDELVSYKDFNILYRAATDNDTTVTFSNCTKPYYPQRSKLVSITKDEKSVVVITEVRNKKGKFIVTDTYTSCEEGVILNSVIHPINKKGYLLRFGKCFYLPSSYDDVYYHGRVGETYNDMREQFVIDDVSYKVKDMTEPNIRPQESGNRMDVTSVTVSNKINKVSFIALNKSFELGIKPYSDSELMSMKHIRDEKRSGTYITIQAFQQGIGTGSCGPSTSRKYKYRADKDYTLRFLIKIN